MLGVMRRSEILVLAAGFVLDHDRDEDIERAVLRRFPPGDDRTQALTLAVCLVFMRDEAGRHQVEQVRGTHRSRLVAEGAA